jgi:site-specific DNA recombinase
MEAEEAKLRREKRRYDGRREARRHFVTNLAEEWDKPDFTMEQKQAAIAESLSAVIILPAGKGARFDPARIVPVFRERDDGVA